MPPRDAPRGESEDPGNERAWDSCINLPRLSMSMNTPEIKMHPDGLRNFHGLLKGPHSHVSPSPPALAGAAQNKEEDDGGRRYL